MGKTQVLEEEKFSVSLPIARAHTKAQERNDPPISQSQSREGNICERFPKLFFLVGKATLELACHESVCQVSIESVTLFNFIIS